MIKKEKVRFCDMHNGLTINKITHIKINEEWLHAPGYSESHRLFSVLEGNLRLWTAAGTVTVSAGETVFLAPVTRIRSCHGEESGVEFFELDFTVSAPEFTPLTLYRTDRNASALLFLIKSAKTQNLKAALLDAFITLASEPADSGRDRALADKVLKFIEDYPQKAIDVDSVAASIGYDRSHISRVFKQVTGKTVKAYINGKKVSFACDLLEASDFTVNKIASLSGFEESNLFTKFFTYHTGLTPSDYRRKLHNIPTVHTDEE